MAGTNNPGEEKAWEILATLEPDQVCRNASVSYIQEKAQYVLQSFGMEFVVAIRERVITGSAPGSEVLLTRLGYFFRLSVLWYLVGAKQVEAGNQLVKLERLNGGDIFTRGSHALPLDAVATKYARDKMGFLEKSRDLGGEPVRFGDAAVRFYPLPRVPVQLSLWLEDEEFPARLDLLLDSTCEAHLPIDIIWTVAMMSILIML